LGATFPDTLAQIIGKFENKYFPTIAVGLNK